MRYLKNILAALLCLFYFTGKAQTDDVSSLLKKIKNNYAGYPDKANGKSFDVFVKGILKNEKDTFQILSKIAGYFNDPHLQLYQVNGLPAGTIDSVFCKEKLRQIEVYLADQGKRKDPREGYWLNERQTIIIAVIKDNMVAGGYKMYLVESQKAIVPPGYELARIKGTTGKRMLTDYLSPRIGIRFFLKTEFRNDSVMTTGDIAKWRKLPYNKHKPPLAEFKSIEKEINGRLLDANNYVLSLPDFNAANIRVIDSLVKAETNKIKSARNLIIDLRDNAGGTIQCYTSILPFICTKPIIQTSGYIRCSPDLLQREKDDLEELKKENPRNEKDIAEAEQDIRRIGEHMGGFFLQGGDTIKCDSIMQKPSQVAIITNFACESAAEMFVLDCKQSAKVTTFGETTMGAVDYLNAYSEELPSHKYIVIMATAKRQILPGQQKIDGTGIPPMVPIPADAHDWAEFVSHYYETAK